MSDPIEWGPMSYYLAAFAVGYALGSIPSGLILTRIAGAGDPREIGSGNIGATNVLRTGGKALAAATLLADVLKGTLAVRLAMLWGTELALVAGLGAVLGHLFPVWLSFRGGKGVATYLGVLFGLSWPVALAFCAVWLTVAAATRYSSLAALIACAAVIALLALLQEWPALLLFVVLTLVVYARHWVNIQRLLAGEESKIGGA